MRKFFLFALVVIMSLTMLCGCTKPEIEETEVPVVDFIADGVSPLFYQNAGIDMGSLPLMGDPFLHYEAEEKLFYLYGTTGGGFDYYTSPDLKDWTFCGRCFTPRQEDWCRSGDRMWAPEMHKLNGRYWLYYSAGDDTDGRKLHCSVAVADSPAGPFTNYIDEEADGSSARFSFDFPSIDGTVMRDKDGKLYYYCAKDQVNGLSTIWGVELENPYTVKEGARIKQLTRVGYSTINVTNSDKVDWEYDGHWNEGPFVIEHNGKYYLTYSGNCYADREYSVGYAVSDSPMGPFVKSEDSLILGVGRTDTNWDYISGVGHSMMITLGEETFIVYHKHYIRSERARRRIFGIDRFGFREDGSMYVVGATISPQPAPEVMSGYKNVINKAKITSPLFEEEEGKMLKDGEIGVYKWNADKTDMVFNEGTTVIHVRFDEPTTVRSVLVYAGTDYDKILKKIDRIEFVGVCAVENVKLDGNYIDQARKYMVPGNAISATLNGDVTVTEIKITFKSDKPVSLSEITVLGK